MENIKKLDSHTIALEAQNLVDTYVAPNTETSGINISDKLKQNIQSAATSDSCEQDQLLNFMEKAQNEILMIMALGAYPRFLKSKQYIDWKDAMMSEQIVREPEIVEQ